jgi:hypothetical protein
MRTRLMTSLGAAFSILVLVAMALVAQAGQRWVEH